MAVLQGLRSVPDGPPTFSSHHKTKEESCAPFERASCNRCTGALCRSCSD